MSRFTPSKATGLIRQGWLVMLCSSLLGVLPIVQAATGDVTPPVIVPQFTTPGLVQATVTDDASGVDWASAVLKVDGVDVTAQALKAANAIRFDPAHPLADGDHAITLDIADKAKNPANNFWTVRVNRAGPVFSGMSPSDQLLPAASRPLISAAFQDPRGIDRASIKMSLNGADVTAQSQITASGIKYTPAQALAGGHYLLSLTVGNKGKVVATQVWAFDVDVAKVWSLAITSPAGGQTVLTPHLRVTASTKSNQANVSFVTLNGVLMQRGDSDANGSTSFAGELDLVDGSNTLNASATFTDGTVRTSTLLLKHDAPAQITILSPADKAVLGRANATSPGDLTGLVERPVTITGRSSKPLQSVTINQQQAILGAGNLEFSFPNFFLHEGSNLLTVVGTDALGRSSSTAITVSVDQTAPIIQIEYPRPGYTTRKARIDVRGIVNDAVEGTFGAPEPSLTVNGVAADVADRYFQVSDLPLKPGKNTLLVRAVDHLGNAREQKIDVIRADLGVAGLIMESGHNQTGDANTELANPFSVLALNDKGEPLANLPVKFEVLRGTGSISPVQGKSASGLPNYTVRSILVRTDKDGRAQAWFTIGKQTGPGVNAVRATASGMAEDVLFTASTRRGQVARLNGDSGTNQIGETGAAAMEILSAVVRDAQNNPLPNVAVQFRVNEGSARFADSSGAPAAPDGLSITVFSDKNGVVAVRPLLGNTPGVVNISASALKNPDGNFANENDVVSGAVYLIRVRAGQDGPASFIGTLYSDKGAAISGARISLGRTALSATTDEAGNFVLNNVPPGRVDLFVDGRTVNPQNDPARPQYPSLHFEAYVVKGQINQLPHPIYLPPLASGNAKVVGGNDDVVLAMPGLEGFSMKVKANSVTFPDGSHVGTLIVSPVAADRLPMAPPSGGAQFGVPAWTIQPAGTRFDPPIEVQMPNATNEVPGDNLPVVQWDHDLGQYVPMGRATVSADGAFLITDAGSGLTKAGWGGLCRYDPNKCLKKALRFCNDCEKRVFVGLCPECQKDPSKNSPPITPPGNSPSPAVGQAPGPAVSGGAWGVNRASYQEDLSCKKLCVNGEEKYGLSGDIKPGSGYTVQIYTQMIGAGCPVANRTAANIARTTAHETKHRDFMMSVINGAKGQIGQIYDSSGACESAKNSVSEKMRTDWQTMLTRQGAHTDFAGDTQYSIDCKNGVTVEIPNGHY